MSTVSPGSTASFSSFSSLSPSYPEQREPLSLVVRDRSQADSTSTPTTTKHWKKSISRNYSGEDRENGPLSPSTSTTAEALLSLGKSIPTIPSSSAPISNRLPVPVAPTRPISSLHHRIVQPWAIPTPTSVTSMTVHSPVSTDHANIASVGSHTGASLARKGPSDISNMSSAILFPSHPLPPIHFKTEPETAPLPLLSLPQQPAPLREVKSNLQLNQTKPPFSLAGKIKTEPVSWHLSPLSPLSSSNNSLFRHTAFTSENIVESSSAVKDKPFHCHECKKSFSTQSGFAKHQQLHCSNQIQRETTCKYCNKSYTSNSALKMHIRTHTLPCKCHECGKSFSRPWLLQGHLRTHTGEKPFACTECSRTFADKSNLRAHLQTHLQNKKYSCPGCQKTFSRMSLLTKHTDSGCLGLQSRNEECVETLTMMSSGLLRS